MRKNLVLLLILLMMERSYGKGVGDFCVRDPDVTVFSTSTMLPTMGPSTETTIITTVDKLTVTTERMTMNPATTHENTPPALSTTPIITSTTTATTGTTGTPYPRTTATTSPLDRTSSRNPLPETATPPTSQKESTTSSINKTSTGKQPSTMTTKLEETSSRPSNTVPLSRFSSTSTRKHIISIDDSTPTTTTKTVTKEGVKSTTVRFASTTSPTRILTETHSSSTDAKKMGSSSSTTIEKVTSHATKAEDSTTTTGKLREATSTIDSTVKTSTKQARTSGRTSSRILSSTVPHLPTDTESPNKDVITSQKPIKSSEHTSTMTIRTTVTPTTTRDDSEQKATTTTRANKIDWIPESDTSTSERQETVSSTKGMTTMKAEEETTEGTTEATTGNTNQRTTTPAEELRNMTDPKNVEVKTTISETENTSGASSFLTSETTTTMTTATTERMVSSESPSPTVPVKSPTTSLLKTTIVPAQTMTTGSLTTNSLHVTKAPTSSVDTTPITTVPKESPSGSSTVVSTITSIGATKETTMTDTTESINERGHTSTETTTSPTTEVTNARTNTKEDTSTDTEKSGAVSSSTTEKETSRPVSTLKTSKTTEEKKSTTTTSIAEIPTSVKQAETAGKMPTTSQATSTVYKDATATETTTKDRKTSDEPRTSPDIAATITPREQTITSTTPIETENKETTTEEETVLETTDSNVSTSNGLEPVTSTEVLTTRKSEQPVTTTTGRTQGGTIGQTSDGDIGATTHRTTTGTEHDSAESSSTETRQLEQSSSTTPNPKVTKTADEAQQTETTEKKSVTTQPEERKTVQTSEEAVDSSQKSGETTTVPSGPPVEHFTDINVGEDESSTIVPDYCSLSCPNEFSEGANYCYMIAPEEKSTTYTMAISFCQMVSGPRSDLATSYDYQDNDNLELFKNMLSEVNRTSDLFFLNMLASANFRKNLKADIVSLSQLTRFLQPIIKSAGSSEAIADVNSICRTTKFCKPNTCSFQQFTDLNKEEVVGLPRRKELISGESIVVRCTQYNTSQTHRIACADTGAFKVHPSLVTCDRPDNFEEEDPSTPLDPEMPEHCAQCYEPGTAHCAKNNTGEGVICHCKDGWTKRTCWKSPDLCTNETCGEHGQCVSLVDHTICVCEYGIQGDRCEVNATETSWYGSDQKINFLSIRTFGVVVQASSTFVLIGIKFATRIFLFIGECEDPQDTYQDYRHALHAVGNLAAVFFTHPDMFGVDAIGCRFFFWMITVCYTLGLVFWVNESINVYTTVRAVNRNTWNKNFEGEDKKYLRFGPRVIAPFVIGAFAILLVCANSWDEVATQWSCFGSYRPESSPVWMPLLLINASIAILGFAFGEATFLLIKNRPHTLVRLHNWFNLNQPANFEIVGKVERNKHFVLVGPPLLFMTWLSLSIASDKNTPYWSSYASIFGMSYTIFNFIQMVWTTPALYGWFSVACIMVLPKRFSPSFDWNSLRNREEVLARYYKRRYKKEQDRKILDEDERKANEQREVDEKNAKLQQKYPNLPSTLLFHCPEEPPVITLPRPFPFDPSGKEYMTSFQREHLARIWTRSYLETRKFHKKSPEKSAFEVVKKELQRNVFQVQTEDRKKQELFALAQWWNSVPAMDRTKLRAHQNTVEMHDVDEDDLLAFEREVSRLASIIDLRENRKRKRLLRDPEAERFKKASDFLKFEPAAPIKCVLFECVDGLGDVRPRKFLKKPPIVLQRQIDELDKVYSLAVAELNKPFNKTYDDDLMVTQWSDTEHSEAVKEIMNVSPSQIGEQPISMNPRKRPLDEFWFDHERPDFVGPREKHEIPIGPYEEYARKCHYYQSLTDAQWSQIEHNSYHMANLRKIRRGEL